MGNRQWPDYLNAVEWMLGFATILDKKCIYAEDAFCLRCPANKSNLQLITVSNYYSTLGFFVKLTTHFFYMQ